VRRGKADFWGENGVLIGKGKETFDKVGKRGTKLQKIARNMGKGVRRRANKLEKVFEKCESSEVKMGDLGRIGSCGAEIGARVTGDISTGGR
jgi:hypothetical protein